MNLDTATYSISLPPLVLCFDQKTIQLHSRDTTLSIPRDQWPALRDFIDRALTLHAAPQPEPQPTRTDSGLKPFNRETALAGAPVRTRDRRRVIAVAQVPDTSPTEPYPLLAWIEGDECLYTFTGKGEFYSTGAENPEDLFME